VVTRQLQVERRTAEARPSETDVLPLCHATNRTWCVTMNLIKCRSPSVKESEKLILDTDPDQHQQELKVI